MNTKSKVKKTLLSTIENNWSYIPLDQYFLIANKKPKTR